MEYWRATGKDSAWALVRAREEFEIVGLLTTTSTSPARPGQLSEPVERVSMHGIRRRLLDAQALALGLRTHTVTLPSPCTNDEYQRRMAVMVEELVRQRVDVVVFGDLFLEDVREYRERMLMGTGLRPVFPLWGQDTRELAEQMIAGRIEATLTCVDLSKLDRRFVGRRFDERLLADLPGSVDPCGERGEFHTFVTASPGFAAAIEVEQGEHVERDGFVWVDLVEREVAGATTG